MNSVYLINNAKVISAGEQRVASVLIRNGRIAAVGDEEAVAGSPEEARVIDGSGCSLIPGLIDAHCHISFDRPKSKIEEKEGRQNYVFSKGTTDVLISRGFPLDRKDLVILDETKEPELDELYDHSCSL